MAGRPRKPTQSKVIQGTFRKDRAPEHEPDPPKIEVLPNPPAIMPRAGKKMWKALGESLRDQGLLTEVDLQTFEICCFNYGLYRAAAEAVFCMVEYSGHDGKIHRRRQKLEEYLLGKNSQTMPEYTAMTKAFQAYKSYMTEFGLSPASRSRIDLAGPAKEDEEVERMKGTMNA